MHRIIYISRSLMGDDPVALEAIVARSSIDNAVAGITGMLWSGGGEIVQALEGEHETVSETMKRISADPRHTDIIVVCDRAVQSRMFGHWGMASPNTKPAAIAATAYLVGYANGQHLPATRRITDVLLSYGD